MRRFIAFSILCFLAVSCTLYIDPVVLECGDCIIPAKGGTFYFQMKYRVTKTTVGRVFRPWEYRVIVGESIISSVLVDDEWPLDSWIELEPDPDYDDDWDYGPWGIPFDVPENNGILSRPVKVEVVFAENYAWGYTYQEKDSYHFDPGDNTWIVAFDAIQEGCRN